ncbi:MAG: hypothetical protein Q4F83_02485 [Eubacteriales bacterium]|nr:hypothetical protein [Eubacteriales bacterium]
MDNQQQYMWRQRKKRNTRITIWILLVILLSAGGTFAYEGMKNSNPLNVAKNYISQTIGVKDMDVETGDRSLNSDNQFVQDYTITYTADGRETKQKINMVQQKEKRFGLFDQWNVQTAGSGKSDMELIVPVGSQVLIDGVAPEADSAKEDDTLSPGAVCYQLTGVDKENSKLQVNGLPFDSYEGTLEGNGSVIDIRDTLNVSENAKVQMEEIGKSMINELFTAVVENKEASSLGSQFDKVANKANLYKAIYDNLYEENELKVSSITFEGFEPVFGEIFYPGKNEESYIGIDMTLSYSCKYEPSEAESETEEDEVSEEETAESESESETGSKTDSDKEQKKEAKFSFRYQNGNCIVTSVEVPGVI